MQITIVGGGYLGAMTALLYSTVPGLKVTLIEKQNKLGGLYSSAWSFMGYHFDFGSRAILATGVPQLDETMLSLLPDSEYPKTTANLREFSFQNGQFIDYSNCLDARTLSVEVFAKGKAELLAITEVPPPQDNLRDQALLTYGSTLTDALIAPAMMKLCGLPLERLDPNGMAIHGLQRIIIADQAESRDLKSQSDFNGARIAYARFDDNLSSHLKTYPLTAGMDDFGARIQSYLSTLPNIDLKMGHTVSGVDLDDAGAVAGLTLEDGTRVPCDHVIWTIPLPLLAPLIGRSVNGLARPTFRNSILAHFLFEGQLKTDAYYVYNYDLSFDTYRASFYANYSNLPGELQTATIEMFHDAPDPDLDGLRGRLFDEIKQMKCISEDARIVESNLHYHRGSWPDFACDFFPNQRTANEKIADGIPNLHLLGKANGLHHSGALVHSANDLLQELV